MHYIDTETMKEVCHRLAVTFFNKNNEPISNFNEVNKALLESALAVPQAGFGDYEKYPDLSSKAAALLYSLIKDHAFPNGNKPIAVVTTFVFLFSNGQRLEVSDMALVRYALKIAKSDARDHQRIVKNARRWIERNIQPVVKTKWI